MINAVEIQNLNKKYDGFSLDNIYLEIPKGSVFGIIGKNGSGKSTLIKSILGIVHASFESLQFMGIDFKNNAKVINDSIAVIFEQSYYDESFTPNMISKIMRHVYPTWDNTTFQMYTDRFDLPQNKKISEFSRGMKMKLEFAIAFSHDTKVLILDEATSGLDPIARDEVLDLLREYTLDEEHTVIMCSHITSDLDKVADYISLIDNGKIKFTKSYDDIINLHGIIKCGELIFEAIHEDDIISYTKNDYGYEVLVRNKYEIKKIFKDIVIENVTLEEVMISVLKGGCNK